MCAKSTVQLLILSVSLAAGVAGAAAPAADTVLFGGHIWTATGADATALVIRDGRLAYVGDDAHAKEAIGPATRVVPLRGRFVMPGLVDAHMHPLDIVDLPVCDLDSRPLTLSQLTVFVRGCLKRYAVPKGGRLMVHQWNYVVGNQTDPAHPTLRAALDLASRDREVQLLGNDGHHAAFNSLGLAHAKNAAGQTVGLSKQTLATDFAAYQKLVGVDATGEPNGAVNEDARYTINPHSMMYVEYARVLPHPEWVAQRVNRAGITAITDAMADPDGLGFWDALYASGKMTMRANLAQFHDPERFRGPGGSVDYAAMVSKANAIRDHFAGNPLIKADTVKIFADGVLEGNPLADPPTLPNGAVLEPLLQPRYGLDAHGRLTVKGYVDTDSPACVAERARLAPRSDAEVAAFRAEHGYHPAQCAVSRGQLQHERDVVMDFARYFHTAGYHLHIHAIGDRAVRTAVDAIEAARAVDGNTRTHDGLAHVQLAHPDDIARIGRDHLYIAYTYAWANVEHDYDLTLIPFLQRVAGTDYTDLHVPGSYYEQNTYPVQATLQAGAIVAAGSDAPVETRDPRPFFNIARAVTRRIPGEPALNANQALDIEDALRAYTINGARWLGIDAVAGSLEAGKSADFVIIDRNPVQLARGGHPETIETTRVLATWFQGKPVYAAAKP
jgi:predicted amidohydrolase YtcJ